MRMKRSSSKIFLKLLKFTGCQCNDPTKNPKQKKLFNIPKRRKLSIANNNL